MCILRVQAHCSGRFFEVLQDEVESCKLVVEEMMSHVLLNLFGEGMVDDVMIHFASSLLMDLQQCSIQILAQCNCDDFVLHPRTDEHMKLAVRSGLSSLLKQLFGSVHVDSVMLLPARSDDGSGDMALFYSL